jgi:hypothetical protein
MNEQFIHSYLPYIVSGNTDFAKDLFVESIGDKDKNLTRLSSNLIGPDAGINLEYQSDKPTNIAALIGDDKLIPKESHKKLLASLLKDEDIDAEVKFTPHIHTNAKYAGKPIELSIGALIRSNKEGLEIGPIIAHELIHKIDLDGTSDLQGHKQRLTEIRDKLIKHIYDNNHNMLNAKSIGPDGKNVSSLAYWMFNKTDVGADSFATALSNSNGRMNSLPM